MEFFSAMNMKDRSHRVTITDSHSESKPVLKFGDLFNILAVSCIDFPVANSTLSFVKVNLEQKICFYYNYN